MIGKKSKFKEHEQNLQNQENTDREDAHYTGETEGRTIEEGQSEALGSEGTVEDTGIIRTEDVRDELEFANKYSPLSAIAAAEGSDEEIQRAEIEAEENLAQLDLLRSESRDEEGSLQTRRKTSASEDGKDGVSTPSEQKTSGDKLTILTPQNIKSDSEMLWDEIVNGVSGKNSGIPMGFNRLNKYLGLRKSIYTTIGAAAGCGKTSLVDCAYVLNPYDWYIKNKHKSKVKFEVIYFSMERKKTYKLAKWLCMKIWTEEKVLMTTDELLSWQSTLDKRKQDMAKFYIDNYFKEMTESGIIKIIDGQQNPTGIYKYMKAHALTKGKEHEISEYEKIYTPDDDNLITNVVHDHAGKTKNENIGGKYDKKLSIDKASEYYCWARDYLGYSPIMINQFNRTSYQDIQFSKKEGGDPDPTVEYWKDSGNVIEDCDVAISLFNPYKYSLEEYMGYTVNDFTDDAGNNKFRGLKIIKNSYGTDNLRIGLGFLGEVGLFKELSRVKDLTQKEINSVINNDFFLGR